LTITASTGVYGGTPTTAGIYTPAFQVTDNNGLQSPVVTLPLVVGYPVLQILTTTLPSGIVASPYNATLTATGGNGTYTWAISSGSLPSGLSLSTAGVISGTPMIGGTFLFVVQVSDTETPPQNSTQPFSITVSTPPNTNPTVVTGSASITGNASVH
jgi:hypothetical protein